MLSIFRLGCTVLLLSAGCGVSQTEAQPMQAALHTGKPDSLLSAAPSDNRKTLGTPGKYAKAQALGTVIKYWSLKYRLGSFV